MIELTVGSLLVRFSKHCCPVLKAWMTSSYPCIFNMLKLPKAHSIPKSLAVWVTDPLIVAKILCDFVIYFLAQWHKSSLKSPKFINPWYFQSKPWFFLSDISVLMAGGKEINKHGRSLSWCRLTFLFNYIWVADLVWSPDGERIMNLLYVIMGLIALSVLIYLFVALLFPERLG